MLFSLTNWLTRFGMKGLLVVLDIGRYTQQAVPRAQRTDSSFHYSPSACQECYEVLRQFIDNTDDLRNGLLVVLAPRAFLEDERRSYNKYDALKMRIFRDVGDSQKENPLAPLAELEEGGPP